MGGIRWCQIQLGEDVADVLLHCAGLTRRASVMPLLERPSAISLRTWSSRGVRRSTFGLFCLYTAVVLALAAWQLRRHDA
jgi:hypothetical protein